MLVIWNFNFRILQFIQENTRCLLTLFCSYSCDYKFRPMMTISGGREDDPVEVQVCDPTDQPLKQLLVTMLSFHQDNALMIDHLLDSETILVSIPRNSSVMVLVFSQVNSLINSSETDIEFDKQNNPTSSATNDK